MFPSILKTNTAGNNSGKVGTDIPGAKSGAEEEPAHLEAEGDCGP